MSQNQFHKPSWVGLHSQNSVHDLEDIEDIDNEDDVIDLGSSSISTQLSTITGNGSTSSPAPNDSSERRLNRYKQNLVTEIDSSPGDLKQSAIFDVDGKSYDAKLYHGKIVLDLIGDSRRSVKSKHVKKISGSTEELYLRDLFGARLRRTKSGKSKYGACQGMELHTYSQKDPNKLKHKILLLTHPSEELCTTWINEINFYTKNIARRPKNLVLYCNSTAASKSDKSDFKNFVSLFVTAGITIDLKDPVEYDKLSDQMKRLDLTTTEGVIVAGGDELVHHVVDQLLKRIQFDNGISLKSNSIFSECNLPVGVIPLGYNNSIAHTVNGTADAMTAVLNIIYGHTLTTDILSASDSDRWFEFTFSAHYGWGGTIELLAKRYKKIAGSSVYQASILKGVTSSKLKSYGCQLKYTLANSKCGQPKDGSECRTGCCCYGEASTPRNEGSVYSDSLHEFDPLDVSNTSSEMEEIMVADKSEGAVKDDYMNLSLFSLPMLSSMAPLGLSKYTHIADGCMDLVLVKPVERKEFVRFVKRLGNSKNQLDLDFVQSMRIKELNFHVRMPVGWSFRDAQYSEIADQSKKRTKEQVECPELILDDEGVSKLTISDDSSTESDCESGSSSINKSITASTTSADTATDKDGVVLAGRVHAIHKYTVADRELKRRRNREMKQEQKKKVKEENSVKSVWNLDSRINNEHLDLTFRCHQRLVRFFGTGLSPKTEISDVKCFVAV